MQTETLANRNESVDQPEAVIAVILYDQAEAGRCAMRALRGVADELAAEVDFQVRLWRCDVLVEETLRKTAAADLAAADVLIISSSQAAGWPANVRNQIDETFRERKERTGLAVVVLSGGTNVSQFAWLRAGAGKAGWDFMELEVAPRRAAESDTTFETIGRREGTITPLLEKPLRRSQSSGEWRACV